MPRFLITKYESIPSKLKNIDLDDKYIFISTNLAVMYYYEEFWCNQLEKNSRLIFTNISDSFVTIFHNQPYSNFEEYSTIFYENKYRKEYSTGSIERDVEKIFNEQIKIRKGIPAGYLKIIYSKWDHIPDLFRGKIFKNDHLDQKVVSFQKYIEYLKKL